MKNSFKDYVLDRVQFYKWAIKFNWAMFVDWVDSKIYNHFTKVDYQ